MRHASFLRWGNQNSFVHQLDPRVKLVLLVAFLASVALLRAPSAVQLTACLICLIAVTTAARIPTLPVLRAALLIVPFIGLFSLLVYISGDSRRAWNILAKSYLSALSVLITVASTPFSRLVTAARFFRVPALLLDVIQLTYRYLFVLAGQARMMQTAFGARGGRVSRRAIEASSGMIAVLFIRSYEKAAMVHQAMAGRGFAGDFIQHQFAPLEIRDLGALTFGLLLAFALHLI